MRYLEMKSMMKFVTVIALAVLAMGAMAAEKNDAKISPVKVESQMSYTQGDKLFAAFEQKDGSIRLVYTGEKPARIYSWTGTKNVPLKDGVELMILNVPGRSKAKVKMYMGGKFTDFARDFKPAEEIKPGEYISRIYELLKLPTLQNYRCACAECYSMLLEIAAQNTAKKQPEELREATDYMQSNVNHPLNLAMITEHCKISRISLYRSFKKHFKQSPFDYFLELKMKRAIQLLKMQVYSVKQIASELNYSSPQYFAMEFKKRYGMTPSQFQKNEQKNM